MVGDENAPFYAEGPIPTARASRFVHAREEERRNLVQHLNKRLPARIAILGPRGGGKTTLILAASPQVTDPVVILDCARVWPATRQGFYLRLLEMLGLPSPTEPLRGPPSDVYPLFAAPRTPQILVLDNAHELALIDPELLRELPLLSARLPRHMVLTGEAAELAPLCSFSVTLEPFSEATCNDFVRSRFASDQITIDDAALTVFYEFTRGLPDALQRIGLAVWHECRRRNHREVRPETVDAAVTDVVEHLPTAAVMAWAAVRGIMRDVFIAMCLYDLTSPTEIAERCGQEPKNVIVLLSRLSSAHDLVERTGRGAYRVRDPLLKHFVRKEWSSPILRV